MDRQLKRICVFCGSSLGADPAYQDVAHELGSLISARKVGLVYGGGSVGLMGIMADTVLAAGGEVIGIIPEGLATRELMHPGVRQMQVVESMHARKAAMAELADAFIALPGGFGTFEEVLEQITWAQLGIHRKPIGVLNVRGYFDPFLAQLERAVQEGFIRPEYRRLLVVETGPEALLQSLRTHEMPAVRIWLTARET